MVTHFVDTEDKDKGTMKLLTEMNKAALKKRMANKLGAMQYNTGKTVKYEVGATYAYTTAATKPYGWTLKITKKSGSTVD